MTCLWFHTVYPMFGEERIGCLGLRDLHLSSWYRRINGA